MTGARRVCIAILVVVASLSLVALSASGAVARTTATPTWTQMITAAIGGRPVSVAIGLDGEPWYGHLGWVRRPPASNEKLLLSMALLNRFSPQRRIRTQAMVASGPTDGVLPGDLWLLGHGDPMTDRRELASLATQLRHAGLRHIRGSVVGATAPFARDWWATGWKWYFPADYVALPTAFTFDRNVDGDGVHITDPELRAARFMTHRLRALGVRVDGGPGMGRPSAPVHQIGVESSPPLRQILHRMNVKSRNFFAEVLGKYLGLAAYGKGSIVAGARAIEAYARNRGVDFTLYDASGLSYANRVTAVGILHLLWNADTRSWGAVLRGTLARGGQGTLKDRFANIQIRAKTGTLDNASALSGWVYAETASAWVEFSIVSSGFDEYAAKKIENQIVRIIAADAIDPQPTA